MQRILVTNIFWQRTHLTIEYDYTAPLDLKLVSKNGKIKLDTKSSDAAGKTYSAKLNICVAYGRQLPPSGEYILDFGIDSKVVLSQNILKSLESFSRIFEYSYGKYSYNVSFKAEVKEFESNKKSGDEETKASFVHTSPVSGVDGAPCADNESRLVIHFAYMMLNKKPDKPRILAESHAFSEIIKKSARLSGVFLCNGFYLLISLFKIFGKKRILLMTENREVISANLSFFYQRLRERRIDEKYNIKTSARNTLQKKYYLLSWLNLIILIALSHYIFIDDYTPVFAVLKLKKTKLIQLWHAGVGFKCVGYSRFGLPGSPHPFKSNHRYYDYGIVGCEALKPLYSEVWGIEENAIIPSGLPRLEHFLEENIISSQRAILYEKYPRLKEKQVILFAPTYRGKGQREAYYDFDKIDFGALYRYCVKADKYVLFKMHHFIKVGTPIDEKFKERLIDVSGEEINNLFYITDVLITDYSSCFYDFLLLNKPIIFYAYDSDDYFAALGMHRDFDTNAPGVICKSFKDLIRVLEDDKYHIEVSKHCYIDRAAEKNGLASDIIIDFLKLEGA